VGGGTLLKQTLAAQLAFSQKMLGLFIDNSFIKLFHG